MKLIRRMLCLVAWLVILAIAKPVIAQSDPGLPPAYLLIHQVRGPECCSPGGLTDLQSQLTTLQTLNLSGYFALRYDALLDRRYPAAVLAAAQHSNGRIRPAVLLEVTPQLAADAGVEYPGPETEWFQAHQAYLFGYPEADRIKLIDQLLAAYHSAVGAWPELSSAWMIDVHSLNYLHDRYGVQVHQTTREQWGLDSYTLYGGPFYYPYPASRSWPFMPDYTATDSAMIVRQTVMDPLWVYGDTSSAFTSQPNDYVLDGKDFTYFTRLLTQAWSPLQSSGFILLGLETSMAEQHQQEYQRQLEWLADQVRSRSAAFATPAVLRERYGYEAVRQVTAEDITGQYPEAKVTWVTTGQYRVRLVSDSNGIRITDIRVYDPELESAYETRLARQSGYWVAPFLLDTSLVPPSSARPWWKFWAPPALHLSPLQPRSDIPVTEGWKLPAAPTFDLTTFFIPDTTPQQLRDSFPQTDELPLTWHSEGNDQVLAWLEDGQPVQSLRLAPESAGVRVSFTIDSTRWSTLFDTQGRYYFPEPALVDTPDADQTIFYVHNRHTWAGRTPVRLVVAPKDSQNRSVGLAAPIQVSTNQELTRISDTSLIHEDTLQFIDITGFQPGAVEVTAQLGAVTKTETIYFAPDCKATWQSCLTKPQYGWWYFRAWLGNKVRSFDQ